ncbi:hypothetical protein DUNSADRAFT_13543 [Dunaliella salina]|uniref:RING-type domain-containing protein n=1 Tax=Dunaliella salina TaxID=3046 RepID=A0ABQ7G969_DUNSA|nr:hypothetical protein DUNSADRAFT_13543 [Dunaliella salina]|eukprot:KAF5831140.1 hypothetical protein DUNSADRAFT_13543 [Dunaliella salina]
MDTQTLPNEPNYASCDGGPGADDLTCPICLHAIDPMELAIVKGCFHEYCACCILKWAACKSGPDPAWCPQCKAPVNYLYLHRQLDGTLSDYPVEESVCLLKVATWFKEHVREADKGKLLSGFSAAEAGDEAYDDDYDYDDDPEEEYYLTGSGRARVVLGNRRLGQNGFMRSGRMYARPVPPTPVSRNKANNNKASSAANHNNSNPPGSSSNNRNNNGDSTSAMAAPGGGGSSGNSRGGNIAGGGSGGAEGSASGAAPNSRGAVANNNSGAGPSSSTGGAKQQGRRAKRSQRRAAYDLAYDLDDDYC